MTTKHTQGPWCVKHDKTGMPYIGVVSDPIDYPGTVAIIDSGYPEADARLIAAAPDLLAALEGLVSALEALPEDDEHYHDFLQCSGKGDCELCNAKAALAKALGE